MRLTNTLTGNVEELRPLEAGKIGLYVCGVTPYAPSHIGHAVSAIVYDVLVRYLRWTGNPQGGYDVTYVSNYTDVDDKLIEAGREQGRDPVELAQQQIERWEREQAALNLLEPDVRPRVSQEIEPIVALIEQIVAADRGYATAEGNVYFRVRSQPEYGKLSRRDIEQLLMGTRFEPGEDKEFPLDFALWKAAQPGEPQWPSPWGAGRPGWHIECSAMSGRYLGDGFDIHGGGMDLVFPHHENEIAQSEAAGRPFARLWMHNGLVQHDGAKMSKSRGNVIPVEQALERWSADAIRLFVLNSHYRRASNITGKAMAAAEVAVERLRRAATRDVTVNAGSNRAIRGEGMRTQDFVDAMENDLDTPAARKVLFKLATVLNKHTDEGFRVEDLRRIQNRLVEYAGVLGLRLDAAAAGSLDAAALAKIASRFEVACGGKDVAETVEALLAHREAARAERDFALADAVRAALADAGVEVEDTAEGARWTVRG